MMSIFKVREKQKTLIGLNSYKQFFKSFLDVIHASTIGDLSIAFGLAVVTAISILTLILTQKPFVTKPVELMGCYAYYFNLNITNRLAGIALCIIIAMSIFIVFTSLSFSEQNKKRLQSVIGYSLLPALLWLVLSLYISQHELDTFWLYLSTGLCWFALLAIFRERGNADAGFDRVVISLVALGLSFFVAPALLVYVKSTLFWKMVSFFVDPQSIPGNMATLSGWIRKIEWIPPLYVFVLWLFIPKRQAFLWLTLYPIQIFLLLFFCLVLPGFFMVDGTLTQFFKSAPVFCAIVLPLFIAGIWDCSRRCFTKLKSPFSPFPFLGLLFFRFLQDSPAPGWFYNAYEFGSRLPGFWVSFKGWAKLFKDVYITYGLWDYAQFLFAWIFSGQQTAAASVYGMHIFNAFILILEFFAVNTILPVGLAFLLCLIVGVGAQSVVVIYMSILLNPRLISKPVAWIVVWILLSAVAPFARIPQGTICVVASFPAFLWLMFKLFEQERKTFWKVAGGLAVAGFLMVIWPFGDYFWGLMRIFSETAKVNSPWAANVWKLDGFPLIQVLFGNAVLILPLISLISGIIIIKNGNGPNKHFIAYFLCSFAFLYSFASISYGFSRADGAPFGRQYQVLMAALVPVIIGTLAYNRSKGGVAACIGVLLCFLTVYPARLPSPIYFTENEREFPKLPGDHIQNAEDYGLPQLGKGNFSPDYLNEDSNLKKALDRVLSPDETFFDLTMVGLHYFSTQRKMITEYPVYYVYPGVKPQLRALEKLSQHNVAVTLLEPGYYDESPSSLRTYYLYRYALLNGLPWEITPSKILLMPNTYFQKIGVTPPDAAQTLRLLDKAFPMTSFSDLPYVWGRGYQEFGDNFKKVRILTIDSFRLYNKEAFIDLSLTPPLKGVDAGLLVFKVNMPEHNDDRIEINWVDSMLPSEINQINFKAHNGMNIIPLDASPRWLLAKSIEKLTVKIVTASINQDERKKTWEMHNALSPKSLPLSGLINCSSDSENKILAQNADPILTYTIPEELRGKNLLIRIVWKAPKEADLTQLFYHSATTTYNENDSERVPISEEMNEVYFIIPKDMASEELRFDPGCIDGVYEIKSVEAKPLTINNAPIKISEPLLYQRPYVAKN